MTYAKTKMESENKPFLNCPANARAKKKPGPALHPASGKQMAPP